MSHGGSGLTAGPSFNLIEGVPDRGPIEVHDMSSVFDLLEEIEKRPSMYLADVPSLLRILGDTVK